MRNARTICGIGILAACILFVGWADTWEELKKGSGDITSISADFVQKKRLRMLTAPLVSRGTLRFRRPQSLRWEYTAPIASVLLINDNSVRRYIRKGGKFVPDAAMNLQAMQVVVQEISLWLRGDFDKNPNFRAELIPGAPRRIMMTPREPGLAKIIAKIEIILSNRRGLIDGVIIHESDENSTELRFVNPVLNGKIGDSLFTSVEGK